MLEDAQSWMNGRKINEIKDKSGTLYSFVVLLYAMLCDVQFARLAQEG